MKKYILYLTIALIMLLASCNSEGTGIFFQISQEVAQITSEISELSVHQVVEVGSNVYALTGRQVWLQNGNSWKDVGNNNFIYDIVEDAGVLYGNINNDDDNMDEGKIMSYNPGTNSWTPITAYNSNTTLLQTSDTHYVLTKKISDVYSTFSSDLLTAAITDDEGITERIIDGASNGTSEILISASNLYGTTYGSFSSYAFSGNIDKSGNFRAITVDIGNNFYITTASGQVYISTDDGSTWTLKQDIDKELIESSLDVVNIGDEFLIIGTDNGYYEMNITSAGSIVAPTETTSNSEFDTSYPELAEGLVHEVYASSAEVNVFYLATENGLWKRIADGTFHKQ